MMDQPYSRSENYDAWAAWQCVCRTNVNIFLTGNAGTGKTTFLKNLQKFCHKRMVVVAPTGVAAINAHGATIHSFFQIAPSLYLPGTRSERKSFKIKKSKLAMIRSLDLLIIDEVSMVRADLLDCIDNELRTIRRNPLPFGGVQLLLVGDLRQLAPVVRPEDASILSQFYQSYYFFGSLALQKTAFFTFELKKIYRQHDQSFINLLNAVRENKLSSDDINLLNSRFVKGFNPSDDENFIRLTTHNASADNINSLKLSMLPGQGMTYEASISGSFPESSFPLEQSILLKEGAQVMFVKNDPQHRFYNGKIGRVVALGKNSVTVNSGDEQGDVEVEMAEWENVQYDLDPDSNEIVPKVLGRFVQIPLRLAWAITIHKSQGLTFDKAIIDAAQSFSAGQVYVALSRCRSLDGLVLSSPIGLAAVQTDVSVNSFLDFQESNRPSDVAIAKYINDFAYFWLGQLFDFSVVNFPALRIQRVFDEFLYTTYPRLLESIQGVLLEAERLFLRFSARFLAQCGVAQQNEVDLLSDKDLLSRVVKGCSYFLNQFSITYDVLLQQTGVEVDNKLARERLEDARADLQDELFVKKAMLKAVADAGFSPEVVIKAKSSAVLELANGDPSSDAKKKVPAAGVSSLPADVVNGDLYEALRVWRNSKASEENVPPYAVMANKLLIGIANGLPETNDELLKINGMGPMKLKLYGLDVLNIVKEFIAKGDMPAENHAISTAQSSPSKEQKIPTRDESVRLFRKLMRVDEVAKVRGLKVATIKGHLYDKLEEEGLAIDDILGAGRFKKLCAKISGNTWPLPEDLRRDLFAQGFDYSDLRFAYDEIQKNTNKSDA